MTTAIAEPTAANGEQTEAIKGAESRGKGKGGTPKPPKVAAPSGRTIDQLKALIAKAPTVKVALADIKPGAAQQVRQGIHQPTVDAYAEDRRNGKAFDPVILARYLGMEGHYTAAGAHRVASAILAEQRDVAAKVVELTPAEALLVALDDNGRSQLPMTLPDRRKACAALLALDVDLPAKQQRSNRAIGDLVGLSHVTVKAIRDQVVAGKSTQDMERELKAKRQGAGKASGKQAQAKAAARRGEAAPEAAADDTPKGDDSPNEADWGDAKWVDAKLPAELKDALKGDRLKAVRRDAAMYRALIPVRKDLGREFAASRGNEIVKADARARGVYVMQVYAFLKIADPSRWLVCGGCQGKGCDACHQAGYHTRRQPAKAVK